MTQIKESPNTVPEVTLPADSDDAQATKEVLKSESIETFTITNDPTPGRRVSYSPAQNFIVESPKTVNGDNDDGDEYIQKYQYNSTGAGEKLKSTEKARNVPLENLALLNPAKYRDYLRQYQHYLQRYQLYIDKILREQQRDASSYQKPPQAPPNPPATILHIHRHHSSRHDDSQFFLGNGSPHESKRRSHRHKYSDDKHGKTYKMATTNRKNWHGFDDYAHHFLNAAGYYNSPSRVIEFSPNGMKNPTRHPSSSHRHRLHHNYFAAHRHSQPMYPFSNMGSVEQFNYNNYNSSGMMSHMHSNSPNAWMMHQANDYQLYNPYNNNMTFSTVFQSNIGNNNSSSNLMGTFYGNPNQSYYQNSSSNQYLDQFNSAGFW